MPGLKHGFNRSMQHIGAEAIGQLFGTGAFPLGDDPADLAKKRLKDTRARVAQQVIGSKLTEALAHKPRRLPSYSGPMPGSYAYSAPAPGGPTP